MPLFDAGQALQVGAFLSVTTGVLVLFVGKAFNELKQGADSTLSAICGRESAYTGKVVAFEQYVATDHAITPAKLEFGPMPTPPVAIPGSGTSTM